MCIRRHKAMSMSMPMSDRPAAVTINLDARPEKLAAMREAWAPLGVQVERFPALLGEARPPLRAGEVGCLRSHTALWRRCAAGTEALLVAEDDALPAPGTSTRDVRAALVAAHDALRVRDGDAAADIVFLSRQADPRDMSAVARALGIAPPRAAAPWPRAPPPGTLVQPARCGLHMYLVSPAGAARLLAAVEASPAAPVDVAIWVSPDGPVRALRVSRAIAAEDASAVSDTSATRQGMTALLMDLLRSAAAPADAAVEPPAGAAVERARAAVSRAMSNVQDDHAKRAARAEIRRLPSSSSSSSSSHAAHAAHLSAALAWMVENNREAADLAFRKLDAASARDVSSVAWYDYANFLHTAARRPADALLRYVRAMEARAGPDGGLPAAMAACGAVRILGADGAASEDVSAAAEVLGARLKSLGVAPRLRALLLDVLGEAMMARRSHAAAADAYEACRAALGPDDPRAAVAAYNAGRATVAAGRVARGLEFLHEAVTAAAESDPAVAATAAELIFRTRTRTGPGYPANAAAAVPAAAEEVLGRIGVLSRTPAGRRLVLDACAAAYRLPPPEARGWDEEERAVPAVAAVRAAHEPDPALRRALLNRYADGTHSTPVQRGMARLLRAMTTTQTSRLPRAIEFDAAYAAYAEQFHATAERTGLPSWREEWTESLLVMNNGGLGDLFMFARLVPVVLDVHPEIRRLWFVCDDPVWDLFRDHVPWTRSPRVEMIRDSDFMAGRVAFPEETRPFATDVLGLPAVLGRDATLSAPPLSVDVAADNAMPVPMPMPMPMPMPTMPPGGARRVFIQWRSSARNAMACARDVPEADVVALFAATPDIEWVFSADVCGGGGAAAAAPNARALAGLDASGEGRAFLGTAALIASGAVEAVVSVDTALCHLAASMACSGTDVDVHILLCALPEWRWGADPDAAETPWYPEHRRVRLWRQPPGEAFSWGGTLRRLAARLAPPLAPPPVGGPPRQVLAPVSVGEALDKITILELKERAAPRGSERLVNVARELAALRAAAGDVAGVPGVAELTDALRATNARLWRLEDRVRELLNDDDSDSDGRARAYFEVASQIPPANDERARLKREINRVAGSLLVEEKFHPTE